MELFIYIPSSLSVPVLNFLITITPELHPNCEKDEDLIVSVTKEYQDLIRKLLKGVGLDRLAGATAKTTPILNL